MNDLGLGNAASALTRHSPEDAPLRRDRAHRQSAIGLENLPAVPEQQPMPGQAALTSEARPLPKNHIAWTGPAVLIRTGRYRLQLSETHGVLLRRDSDGSWHRADDAVCAEDQRLLTHAIEECLARPLRPARCKTAATLRRLVRAGIFGTTAIRPRPNHHTCPDPSAEAPCVRCTGCSRLGYRFLFDNIGGRTAAHRLSEGAA
jgi:hypothetical protein